MVPYLEHTHHRAVFDRLIDNEYRDKPLTRAQIAAPCRCPESTEVRVEARTLEARRGAVPTRQLARIGG
jgi:hypothetical protein